MPITPTTLNSGVSTIDSSVFISGAYTPTSNSLLLAAFSNLAADGTNTGAGVTGVEGNGATWVQVRTQVSGGQRINLFRAMPSTPALGATTFRFTNAQSHMAWAIAEFAGVSTASTDGAGAVAQATAVLSSASTSLTAPLAPFAGTSNVAFGVFSMESTLAITTGAGFTALSSAEAAAEPLTIKTQYAVNTTAVTMTFGGNTTVKHQGIGIEITELFADEFRIRRKMVGVGR